jgi:uncharacterized protein YidB (DUF937 family)
VFNLNGKGGCHGEAKAGISPEEISGKIAEFLPGVIDKLTPDGAVPEGDLLEKGMELI